MLRSTEDLNHYAIRATDGEIGHVKDFYFDDDDWVVRYFVVDAGSWLSSRKVLISPIAVKQPDWVERTLPVSLTKEQVRNSPDIDTDKPVSRQYESSYVDYYGYPNYWGGGGMWGEGIYPYSMFPGYAWDGRDRVEREREERLYLSSERSRRRNSDPHLRSCKTVMGYRISATDGEIGQVAGYLVDDETWAIRYLVVETGHWWAGHKVLIAPTWIAGVHWSDETVSVELNRESVKNAPLYDSTVVFSQEQDRDLYRHYGRNGYWAGTGKLDAEL
jgi:uncharacterized protein YrrD